MTSFILNSENNIFIDKSVRGILQLLKGKGMLEKSLAENDAKKTI